MSSRNDEIRRQLGFGMHSSRRDFSEMVITVRQYLPAEQRKQDEECDGVNAALLHGVELAPFSGNQYFFGSDDSQEN